MSKLLVAAMALLSFSVFATDLSMTLTGEDRIDNFTSNKRINLEARASDGYKYQATVVCIKSSNNSAKLNEGFIQILRTSSHIGSSVQIDYNECLGLVAGLKANEVELDLVWNKEDFLAFLTGSVEYKVRD